MRRLQNCLLLVFVAAGGTSAFLVDLSLQKVATQNEKDGFAADILKATRVDTDEENTKANEKTDSHESSNHSLCLFSLPAWNLLETRAATKGASSAHAANAASAHAALLVRRLWDWKDDVLGDGRDFFVPRPKTLLALNQLLRHQLRAKECVVLSNCARFDILLVMENKNREAETQQQVAQALLQQYEHYKEQNRNPKLDLTSWLDGGDTPKRLLLEPTSLDLHENDAIDTLDIRTLANNLQCIEGPDDIARYLCQVAAGLQAQGRRPDRDVIFRPFSSRDAHVMLQLKRTADIASTSNSGGGSQPRTKALLDTALQSGKAARNPAIVPAILPLKKYGSGGSSSRYSLGEAPADITEEAAKQAHVLAIEPMVAKYVEKWVAFEVSNQIVEFRLAVEREVEKLLGVDLETSEAAKPIRRLMHPHVMNIREGREADMALLLQQIRELKV